MNYMHLCRFKGKPTPRSIQHVSWGGKELGSSWVHLSFHFLLNECQMDDEGARIRGKPRTFCWEKTTKSSRTATEADDHVSLQQPCPMCFHSFKLLKFQVEVRSWLIVEISGWNHELIDCWNFRLKLRVDWLLKFQVEIKSWLIVEIKMRIICFNYFQFLFIIIYLFIHKIANNSLVRRSKIL